MEGAGSVLPKQFCAPPVGRQAHGAAGEEMSPLHQTRPGLAHRPRWMRREGSPWSQGTPSALWVTTILAGGRRYFNPHATATFIYSLHAPGKILKKVLVPQWIRKLMRGERSQPLPKSPCKYSKALLKTYQHQQAIRTSNSTLLSNCPCLFQ